MREKLPLVEMNQAEIVGSNTVGTAKSGQHSTENLLRPKNFSEYIGQKAAAAKLEIFVEAAKKRKTALDHVLLSGPPGLGKTTLAHIVAHEMGGRLHQIPGPTIEKTADLLSILSELKSGDVLFIDEIHRLSSVIEETLYPAMEDFEVQIIVGEGPSSQSIPVSLERFTLVGATTQPGRLTAPFRDRFGIHLNLDFYNYEEMKQILTRSSKILETTLSPEEIAAIAKRSRGTPRIANRLVARVRDFLQVLAVDGDAEKLSDRAQQALGQKATSAKAGSIEEAVEKVAWALDFLEVDERGLQNLDRRYLRTLIELFKGGPAGVEAIAASLSEDRTTLEETLEPFLLKEGFIVRTARGRIATDAAYMHLGLSGKAPVLEPEARNLELF